MRNYHRVKSKTGGKIMNSEAIIAAVERFGLTMETVAISDAEEAFKVYKGAKQIFVGRAADIATFLVDYEKNLPGLYEGSIYGYKE